eukprot:SAG25_NODE_1006_length_4335_cov_4.453494_4_plen_141_part_00
MQAYVALGLSKLGTVFLPIFIIVVVTVGAVVIHIDIALIHGSDARPAHGTCDRWDRTRGAHTSLVPPRTVTPAERLRSQQLVPCPAALGLPRLQKGSRPPARLLFRQATMWQPTKTAWVLGGTHVLLRGMAALEGCPRPA